MMTLEHVSRNSKEQLSVSVLNSPQVFEKGGAVHAFHLGIDICSLLFSVHQPAVGLPFDHHLASRSFSDEV